VTPITKFAPEPITLASDTAGELHAILLLPKLTPARRARATGNEPPATD
jgi:hypothetical protein